MVKFKFEIYGTPVVVSLSVTTYNDLTAMQSDAKGVTKLVLDGRLEYAFGQYGKSFDPSNTTAPDLWHALVNMQPPADGDIQIAEGMDILDAFLAEPQPPAEILR